MITRLARHTRLPKWLNTISDLLLGRPSTIVCAEFRNFYFRVRIRDIVNRRLDAGIVMFSVYAMLGGIRICRKTLEEGEIAVT